MTLPESGGHSGLLTQTTFLSLFSHPGRSSPTLRGVGVREIFMCQPIPLPPPDVDFSAVRDSTSNTVRDRLLEHATNPGCSVCHTVMDPPGLALEHFDGLGQPQLVENGKPINVSATVDGTDLVGSQGLGRYLAQDPRTTECLVNKLYAYGTGRAPTSDDDKEFIAAQTGAFAQSGYNVPVLLKQIASSPEFLRVRAGNVASGISAMFAGTDSSLSAEQTAEALKAFERVCAACHGASGEGRGELAPKLTGLTDVVAIRKRVADGGGRMPPMGPLLSATELEVVSRYVAGGLSSTTD